MAGAGAESAASPAGSGAAPRGEIRAARYVPGDGLYTTSGELLAEESSLRYVEDKGLYVDGALEYVRDTQMAAPAGSAEIPMISVEAQRERLLETLGEQAVVFDPETGEYTVVDGESLLPAELTRRSLSPEEEVTEPEMIAAGEDTFAIGHGLGRTLTEREQSGFLWLAVIGAAGAAVLVMIYLHVRKSRKDK